MKRLMLPLFLLAFVLSGALTVNAQPANEVRYFVELHPSRQGFTFHVTAVLNESGMILADRKFFSADSLTPFQRELLAIPGVDGYSLSRHDTSFYLDDGANMAAAINAAKVVLERQVGHLEPEEPEPHGVICKAEGSKSGSFGQVPFLLTCQPNRDMIEYNFGAVIGARDIVWHTGYPPERRHSALVTELSKIEGLESIYLDGNELSLGKGQAYRWAELDPQVRNVLLRILKSFAGFRKVDIVRPPNYEPLVMEEERIPGDGIAYFYSEKYYRRGFQPNVIPYW